MWVWSREKAEMKATREEMPSNQKRRHKASQVWGWLLTVSPQCPCPGWEWGKQASNNTGTWLQKSAIRWNTETCSPFLQCCCMCLDQEEEVHGLWIHPGQVRWCGDLKPPPVEPTVCADMTWHADLIGGCGYRGPGMVEEAKVLFGRKRPEGERDTDCLLPWRLVPHT